MTEPGPIAGARQILRDARHATLATLTPEGAPFASLVAMATDSRGQPILLLSDLARHSQNLAGDTRVSLLLDGTAGMDDRLMGPRLTLTGVVERFDDPEIRQRYLASHPTAEMLLSMSDFRFYRMAPGGGHQVAGFGRIDGFDAADLLVEEGLASELAQVETGAIAHMHEDHADSLKLLAGEDEVRLVSLDADGLNLIADGRPMRAGFAARLEAVDQLRGAITQLVRQIRSNSD
ncbi:MAG: DUF2470 domain-containing protein [Rhodospirillaceae bacterium]|jgi:heme iron utilization protein|nr:DUF2470 domain-containing protein [Rhodospirillaceae bacterium]MBT6205028.1 DUF2470 domain-containing protein [Rhodospirillaceae bacterium]MBT6509472.1 DUF2470 domain-containing protein [Rhodospirillaceae bacterium]MBT7613528.1 DUF2470 domain-containing protein [Rhodospirillaceae bacterium]MBT7645955.1 DUF2470 domain-containing protein [Rhodospirillaceae bacterium]